ncbi:zinc metalloprotease HtpX [uncultured Clostridium sp.]|uniref:zinc metalloprotease HtpX n=1 Tax=uncultured Clostridium sp. TaxID=59620 RepID=UPI0028F03A18|nr:zinc metalloprotease HtpX [uncultured Clostridium sp.]
MTYFIDFSKNIAKRGKIGVLIYLILNTLIVISVFSDGFKSLSGIIYGLGAYILSLIIALSPVGEFILRVQTGCTRIKRKEYIERLEPLFNEVLAKAKKVNLSIPGDVKLFMNGDSEPNAFATGRKTICLTKGFLNYSDEQIKATFAHELGHLAHKDTDLILMVTIGNFIVTAIFIFYRILVMVIGFFIAIVSKNFAPLLINLFIDIILVALMWIWTKIGTILVMHSSRQNEYQADEFAYKCGYGDSLASVLDTLQGSGTRGLWANLASTHPSSDDRIARLQNLGINYRN